MKYLYSQLASDSVVSLIQSNYTFTASIVCQFFVLGLHDNYLINSQKKKYIFRIYRNDWRNEQQIQFELDLLAYLKKQGANISAAILTRLSEKYIVINSPEGNRVAALFNYAAGQAPSPNLSSDICALLGDSVAKLHEKSQKFNSSYTRAVLDRHYLVDESVLLIRPFLTNSQDRYIQKIQSKIQHNDLLFDRGNSDFGICVGDINASNFHITADKNLTHFDFDQCGFGFRAFDIAKFFSSLSNTDTKKANMTSFLKAYTTIRPLSENELNSLLYYEMVAVIWVLAIHVSNINKIGLKYLDSAFWDNRIKRIAAIEREII